MPTHESVAYIVQLVPMKMDTGIGKLYSAKRSRTRCHGTAAGR